MHVALRHPSPHVDRRPEDRPDPIRILGFSTAIAVNVCALALLLAPLPAPGPLPTTESPPTWVIPVVPPRPIEVPVAPPRVEQAPRQVQAPPRQLRDDSSTPAVAVVVDSGVMPMTVELPSTAAATDPVFAQSDPGPAAMRLEYAAAPPPPYPRTALRSGAQGTVLLQVLVATDGRPLDVSIAESSGHRDLDAAARRQVLAHWRFRPALQDGRPVQAIGLVPIAFSLQ